jgi:hypothetical protein
LAFSSAECGWERFGWEIWVAQGGTSVFRNVRDVHPRVYAMAGWFALGAVGATGMGGLIAAYRTSRISTALRVGVWSGLLSGSMVFVICMSIVTIFHGALMQDPSNIREFARAAHRAPTAAELSSFLYWDALGGAVNHLWIGPLLGLTIGGIGAVIGKAMVNVAQGHTRRRQCALPRARG